MTTMRRRISRDRSTSVTDSFARASPPADQAGAAGGKDRIFVISLVAKSGSGDPILALRHLLKIALRRFQLRCIDVHERV